MLKKITKGNRGSVEVINFYTIFICIFMVVALFADVLFTEWAIYKVENDVSLVANVCARQGGFTENQPTQDEWDSPFPYYTRNEMYQIVNASLNKTQIKNFKITINGKDILSSGSMLYDHGEEIEVVLEGEIKQTFFGFFSDSSVSKFKKSSTVLSERWIRDESFGG